MDTGASNSRLTLPLASRYPKAAKLCTANLRSAVSSPSTGTCRWQFQCTSSIATEWLDPPDNEGICSGINADRSYWILGYANKSISAFRGQPE